MSLAWLIGFPVVLLACLGLGEIAVAWWLGGVARAMSRH